MGTDWAEILGGCQSRETEQLLPWSFLKFTNKKVVILKFWFVLSARARARSARPPRAGGPGLPHVQKRQVKQVLPRARVEIWRSIARAGRACCVVFWLQWTIATSTANWGVLICSEIFSHRGVKWRTWKVGSRILRESSSMGFSAQNPGFETVFWDFDAWLQIFRRELKILKGRTSGILKFFSAPWAQPGGILKHSRRTLGTPLGVWNSLEI